MRMSRVVLRAGAAAFVLTLTLSMAAFGAEGERKVFGFISGSEASPLAWEYNQPSFGVPATPTFELRFMHSAAESDNGPFSHALASALWPGDLAGSAPPSLLFDQVLSDVIDQLIPIEDVNGPLKEELKKNFFDNAPSYPVKAETLYPQGPTAASTQVGGGVGMRSAARDGLAEAATNGQRAGIPAVFSAEQLNSTAFSGIRDGIAVAEAASSGSALDLFGGIIKVDQFSSSILATSDGAEATLDSRLSISGLTIYDPQSGQTHEISHIDDRGLVFEGEGYYKWEKARGYFAYWLEPYGITITLLDPKEEVEGAKAERLMSGLEIRLDNRYLAAVAPTLPEPIRTLVTQPGASELAPLYEQLPPTVAGLVDSLVAYDQSVTFVIGHAAVNTVATKPFTLPEIVTPPVPPQIITVPGPPSPPQIVTQQVPVPVAGGPSFDPRPVAVVDGTALSVGLAVLVALLAMAGSAAMRRFALVAAAPPTGGALAEACSLEER